MIILYLSAGSDFTEKWYSKTHATFFKRFIKHSTYITDLVNPVKTTALNSNSYRKLIHCVWIGENIEPSKTTFSELRIQTQEKKC